MSLILTLAVVPAEAHRQGESYVYLDVTENSLSGRFELTNADLDLLFKLDTDDDGAVSQAEMNAKAVEIYRFFEPRLSFIVNQKPVSIAIEDHQFLEAGFSTYVQLNFRTSVSEPLPDEIEVKHRSYFEDGTHELKTLLLLASNSKIGLTENEATHSLIFRSGDDQQSLSLVGAPVWEVFWTFLEHGIVHILIGLDHVAFLLVLLLPSVMIAINGRWQPVDGFKPALLNVLTIVTLFTIAHSVTLTLAALDLVSFPEWIIEALIAASIVVVALNNILIVKAGVRWIAVFGLGLLHGLGFANVLAPLGVAKLSIFTSLVGFNLGVEVGQACIVIACFPILYFLRRSVIYKPFILTGGSVILLLIALLWFFERAFGFNIPLQAMF